MTHHMYTVEVERVNFSDRSVETWIEYTTATSAEEAARKVERIHDELIDPDEEALFVRVGASS